MSNAVNPPASRSRRQVQAEETRTVIVAAARELFLAQGYVPTSIDAVSVRAGVAIQTIYNSVGGKPALLSAVLDAAVAGPNAPASVPEFMKERMSRTTDVAGAIGVLADWFTEGLPRSHAIFTAISQGAAVDPAVAALRDARAMQRLHNYRQAAAAIRQRGGLSNGMSDDDGAAVIFALGHPDTYATLVHTANWDVVRYRDWVHAALLGALS